MCTSPPEGFASIRQCVPLVYEDNPNGSLGSTAAVLDATGHVLGVMPHPERASDIDLGSADGMLLFRAAHTWLSKRGA